MDKIFGSWWPWGRQESHPYTILSPLPSSTTIAAATATTTTSSASTIQAAATASATTQTQQFITSTTTVASTTISTVFTTLINNQQNDMFNGTASGNGTGTSTSSTESLLFGNESVLVQLQSIDFPEDELLFAGMMMWNNSTATVNFQLEHNGTNVTNVTTKLDFETTWHLLSAVLTAVLLGFVILATVIGKCTYSYESCMAYIVEMVYENDILIDIIMY